MAVCTAFECYSGTLVQSGASPLAQPVFLAQGLPACAIQKSPPQGMARVGSTALRQLRGRDSLVHFGHWKLIQALTKPIKDKAAS
ncbi:hypothetical protein I79_024362 [Cricetulus griseus]|uniref:Uncharacterized protein n=1 Tax=Cricetulus griseus TaxID=10029 RepID=G3IKG0_CRIGR|nr:hypothetical protein I79_024362 [Cricetulus griseus]